MSQALNAVTPETIALQRERGWLDFHPEDYCHRCGTRNITWSVDSDRFNLAVEALDLTITAIICIACFIEGHEKATGLRAAWTLVPWTHFRPLSAGVSTETGDAE